MRPSCGPAIWPIAPRSSVVTWPLPTTPPRPTTPTRAGPKNPAACLLRIASAIPLVRRVALGAQHQLATFLAWDDAVIVHREPIRLFEPLLDLNSLEDLDYIP